MPGTVRIWWHDGAARDARNNDMPVVREPELGFELVAVSATPSSSGPAPVNAMVALVESDVDLRYRVRRAGDATPADPADCKPMPATGGGLDFIGVAPGCTISFVEA
jgi:hypothetical protein